MKRTSSGPKVRLRLPRVSSKICARRTDDEFLFDKQIAAKLLAGRAMRDLTQGMLAAKLGLTFQQIQKYETAKTEFQHLGY